MNSIERLESIISGEFPDRPAVSLTLSLYGARLIKCGLEDYYQNPVHYAAGQSAVYEMFQPDILFAPFSFPLEGKAFGSKIRFFKDHPPNLITPSITGAEQIKDLVVPDLDHDSTLNYFRESIRLMHEAHGKEMPIAAVALTPVDLPAMIMGMEGWLETLLFHPLYTQQMLDKTIPFFIKRINTLFAAGATLAVLPMGVVNSSVITRQIAIEKAIPPLKEAFSQVNGPVIIHSAGTKIGPFIDLFTPLPNVTGFVVDARDDIKSARKTAGEKMILLGNIDGPGLNQFSPKQIATQCANLLTTFKEDPYFILGTTGPDIPIDTPIETIKAIVRSVKEI
jgi:uroporphyrinogen decarboxylase